jgi:hypothetical protein
MYGSGEGTAEESQKISVPLAFTTYLISTALKKLRVQNMLQTVRDIYIYAALPTAIV